MDKDSSPMAGVFGAALLPILIGGILGVIAAVATWFVAPQVGGEWWPYIHVAASLVVGYIVFQVVAMIVGFSEMVAMFKSMR